MRCLPCLVEEPRGHPGSTVFVCDDGALTSLPSKDMEPPTGSQLIEGHLSWDVHEETGPYGPRRKANGRRPHSRSTR